MKTNIEIEIKKIRKKLGTYGLNEEEKTFLRTQLAELKAINKMEKST